MPTCHCVGPSGWCRCKSGTNLHYDTKVVEARRPAFKPEAPEDRVAAFSVKELEEIMRERGLSGVNRGRNKDYKVQRVAEDIGDDLDVLAEYESRYGRSGG